MSQASSSLTQSRRWWHLGAAKPKPLPIYPGCIQGGAALQRPNLDQALLWVSAFLLAWGLVMVYSASIAMPENPRFSQYAPSYFVLRHAIWLVLAGSAGLAAFQVSLERWEQWAPWLFVLSLILLALVLVPGVGKKVYGAKRWIGLGPISFQPSELVKFAILLYAASFMVRKLQAKETSWRAVIPMGVALAVAAVLLLNEPDLGALVVIAVIATGILFLGGINLRVFCLLFAMVAAIAVVTVAGTEFRRQRMAAFFDPWSQANALGKGYQLTHALIAFGRGEVSGAGLGLGVEKLNWLPEAHTDFLLAVIGEEFGLFGVLLLIGIFFWLIRRMMQIGRQAITLKRVFPGLVAQGVALWLGLQVFINMGVNLGTLPTKGLTLPLMSYGGSAIFINLVAIAVVLRVDYENKLLMRGGWSEKVRP